MDIFQIKQGRYFLYLDILGFRELVHSQSTEAIYETIDNAIKICQERATRIQDFGVLCFSDTIIFYQKPQGWGSWAFYDIYAISGIIWSELAAKGIPSRGVITFGDFNVRKDSTDSHDLFWGKALIQAYDLERSEKNRNFIGIILSPQALQAVEYMEKGTIKMHEREHVFRTHCDQMMFLNPFWHLRHAYSDYLIGELKAPYTTWNAPEFPDELKALAFIMSNRKRDESIAIKYRSTYKIFESMIRPEALKWYLDVYEKELSAG